MATEFKLVVRRGEPELVHPVRKTKNGPYFLSNLDQNVAVVVRTVYFYKAAGHGNEAAAAVVKGALAAVLVDYYPLAGRLFVSPEKKLAVDCTGDGAVFVEADADCDLAALGDISTPDPAALRPLIYDPPTAENSPEMLSILLAAQLTRFRCGGFTVGLAMNHCMFDGIAAMEFVNSWAETARGSPLSTPPFLDRSLLAARSPPQILHSHGEFAELHDISGGGATGAGDCPLLYRSFCFEPAQLEKLKQTAAAGGGAAGGLTKNCTSFEVLSALIWQARVAALRLDPSQQTKLLFAVDARRRVAPALPRGYFGNGVVLTYAVSPAGELVKSPLSLAVDKVQRAIAMVNDGFVRSAIDFFELTRARPSLAATLLVTAWSKLAFHAADFGWGPPLQAGPVALPEKEVVLFLSQDRERKGVNVLLGLPADAMVTFQKHIEPYLMT